MKAEATNPKDDKDAGLGSAGETVMRAAQLLQKASRAEFISDADKWVRRAREVSAALLNLGATKAGKKALEEIFRPQRVDREVAQDESHLGSRVGAEDFVDPDATPASQLGQVESEPESGAPDTETVSKQIASDEHEDNEPPTEIPE